MNIEEEEIPCANEIQIIVFRPHKDRVIIPASAIAMWATEE